MKKKITPLLVISISIIALSGCTPSNDINNRNASITHTHNGVAHTHKLPAGGLQHAHNIGSGNANRTCQPCANNNNGNNNGNNGNCHLHQGRRHCHPLPASGSQHTHQFGVNEQVNNPVIRYQPSTSTTIPYGTNNNSTISNSLPATNPSSYYRPDSFPTETIPPYQPPTPYSPPSNNNSPSASIPSGNCDTASGNYYVVRAKDGVYRIGVNNGVKRNDIIRLNNLQAPDYTIQPGQCLRLR